MVQLVEKELSLVSERRMPDIMPDRDRLDEIEIQPQRSADRARDSRNKLHVCGTTGNIVVSIKREHLSFVAAAVKKRTVNDFIHVD